MDGFDIATDRISRAATGVEQVAETLGGEIATMEGLLDELSVGWQSSTAAPRFVAAMNGYLEQARQLAGALLGHSAGLAETSTAYGQVEESITQATPAVAG